MARDIAPVKGMQVRLQRCAVVVAAACLLVLAITLGQSASRARAMSPLWEDTPDTIPRLDGANVTFADVVRLFPRTPVLIHFAAPGGVEGGDARTLLRQVNSDPAPMLAERDVAEVFRALRKNGAYKGGENLAEISDFLARRRRAFDWDTSGRFQQEYVSRERALAIAACPALGHFLNLDDGQWPFLKLWFNPEGFETRLHTDKTANLVFQVAGRKRWALVSPRHLSSLDPERGVTPQANDFFGLWSPYDAPERYDGLYRFTDVELGPGDALWLPHGYGHYVRTVEESAMLSFNPRPSLVRALGSP